MTYADFLRAMKNDEVITTFKGTRTMLTVEKLNDCQAVVHIVFFRREDEPKSFTTRMDAVMLWEEAWHAYDTFESND